MINHDYLIERKRNKKQLTHWKLFALLLLILLCLSLSNCLLHIPKFGGITHASMDDYIASVNIDEVITEDVNMIACLEDIAKNSNIKALLVNINSPGGSVVGAEMLYNALRNIAKTKPVVVLMGTVAASGGYLAALGGDYIVAHNGTVTGSIGVILQSSEITELAQKIGIKLENFKSHPLKASPNPMEKTDPIARAATMDVVYQIYDYFIEQVSLRRNLNIDYVRKIADGRIYSGRQAYNLHLVDIIGNKDTALEWLYSSKQIDRNLKIKEINTKPKSGLMETLIDHLQTKLSTLYHYSSLYTLKFLM